MNRQKLGVVLGLFIGFLAWNTFGAKEEPAHLAGTAKIATVDMQKALQTVKLGVKAKSELEGALNKKKKELEKKEAELRKASEDFQKQSLVMNEEARSAKQAELQQRFMKFQEETAKSQMELQKREQELTNPIVDKLRDIISDIAKQKSYTVVLEKNRNSVLYSLDKDDLTDDVIKQFDQKHKG